MLQRMVRWFRLTADVTEMPLSSAPATTLGEDLADAGMAIDDWIQRRLSAGRLYVDLDDNRVRRLSIEDDALMRATVEAADRVLRHEFDLLGSGPYTPTDPDRVASADGYQPIDWYLDPVAGLRFPRGVPHTEWNLERMRPGRADIKLPWELARCQHWAVLGQAYRLTRDDRYAVEIVNQLLDFMAANPVGRGVNWTCTMDVAIRAANWALGLELVRSCLGVPVDSWRGAYAALFAHGAFIERNLENGYEVTSNHFLSNVVGLFYLAAVFHDLPRGTLWDQQCRAWLEQEMAAQVLPDGADYESSVPYHRLVLELFLGAARVAAYRGQPLPAPLLNRIGAMVRYLAAVIRPDGLMPQIGDADDGRLHVLSGYGTRSPQDPRHLTGPAAAMFADAACTLPRDEWCRWEATWWGLDDRVVADTGHGASSSSTTFPHAGVAVVRHERDYLAITNGVVGTAGFGNHKHNDLLGFEYHVDGVPLFVDPGSYVYTSDPDARNLFRSTRLHNTLSIDGQEQNELRPEWLFRLFEKARPERLQLSDDEALVVVRGRHHGYERLSQPVIHERAFTFSRSRRTLIVLDSVDGFGMHTLRWHFHFDPRVQIVPIAGDTIEIRAAGVSLTMTAPAGLERTVEGSWYSPSYGVRVPCAAVDFHREQRLDGPYEFRFEIRLKRANRGH